MRLARPLHFAALTSIAASLVVGVNLARASIFGQEEVVQSNFAAIATPFGSNQYNLLIVEQIPGQRQCWSESGGNPIVINPLLLSFDFTGSCRRSVDSNGYSVRINGQDYGLDYLLRVSQRGNDLQLLATPRIGTGQRLSELLIGRTYGVTGSYVKILLEPGWRYTKRTYQGQTLGHIYLTYDGDLGTIPQPGPSPTPAPSPSPTPAPSPTPTPSPSPAPAFQDIVNDIYRDEITAAVNAGFIKGFEDRTFRPLESLTREQLVSMVLDAVGTVPNVSPNAPASVAIAPFPDVAANRWSAPKIQWARANGLVTGYPEGDFRPAQAVTRAELMVVMRKAAEYVRRQRGQTPTLTPKNAPTNFADTTTHWANDLIREMSSYCNVASPVNERGNQFMPNTPALRNYAAAATLRLVNCVRADTP